MGLIAYKKAPCLRCAVQQPGCHGSCEGYIEHSARLYDEHCGDCPLNWIG